MKEECLSPDKEQSSSTGSTVPPSRSPRADAVCTFGRSAVGDVGLAGDLVVLSTGEIFRAGSCRRVVTVTPPRAAAQAVASPDGRALPSSHATVHRSLLFHPVAWFSGSDTQPSSQASDSTATGRARSRRRATRRWRECGMWRTGDSYENSAVTTVTWSTWPSIRGSDSRHRIERRTGPRGMPRRVLSRRSCPATATSSSRSTSPPTPRSLRRAAVTERRGRGRRAGASSGSWQATLTRSERCSRETADCRDRRRRRHDSILGCRHRTGPVEARVRSPSPPKLETSSRDGRRSARADGSIVRLTGDGTAELVGHSDRVTSVAFSPDGNRLVSASRDNDAILWDARNGKLLRVPCPLRLGLRRAFQPGRSVDRHCRADQRRSMERVERNIHPIPSRRAEAASRWIPGRFADGRRGVEGRHGDPLSVRGLRNDPRAARSRSCTAAPDTERADVGGARALSQMIRRMPRMRQPWPGMGARLNARRDRSYAAMKSSTDVRAIASPSTSSARS